MNKFALHCNVTECDVMEKHRTVQTWRCTEKTRNRNDREETERSGKEPRGSELELIRDEMRRSSQDSRRKCVELT